MEQTTALPDNMETLLSAGVALMAPKTSHGGIPFVTVPAGYKVHNLETLLPKPARKQATVTVS